MQVPNRTSLILLGPFLTATMFIHPLPYSLDPLPGI